LPCAGLRSSPLTIKASLSQAVFSSRTCRYHAPMAPVQVDPAILAHFCGHATEQGKVLAPRLIDEKIYQNTPTYDMHDHEGDEIVEIPLPDLAQQGDKVYCTVVIEQCSGKPAFYTVAYDYALTADDIASGERLTFPIARGWHGKNHATSRSLAKQPGSRMVCRPNRRLKLEILMKRLVERYVHATGRAVPDHSSELSTLTVGKAHVPSVR